MKSEDLYVNVLFVIHANTEVVLKLDIVNALKDSPENTAIEESVKTDDITREFQLETKYIY